MFRTTYLGARMVPGEPEHIGPVYEVRKLREDLGPNTAKPRWGREFHAMCADGYRVPVLFRSYRELGTRALVQDLPLIARTLARFALRRVGVRLPV